MAESSPAVVLKLVTAIGWRQPGNSHIHGHFTVFLNIQLHNPTGSFHFNAVFTGQLSVTYKFGEAAGAVAAVFYFAAIAVENSIAKIYIRLRGDFHNQQLIATDAKAAIRNLTHFFRVELYALPYRVDNNKVVTQPVHFCEAQSHNALLISFYWVIALTKYSSRWLVEG